MEKIEKNFWRQGSYLTIMKEPYIKSITTVNKGQDLLENTQKNFRDCLLEITWERLKSN